MDYADCIQRLNVFEIYVLTVHEIALTDSVPDLMKANFP